MRDDGTVELRQVDVNLAAILGSLDPLPDESLDLDREIAEAIDEHLKRRKSLRPRH